MPSCSGACGNLRDGNVSHWMYLQFLHPTSGTLKKTHFGRPTTPAMAAALTDHIWSIQEVLWHKVVPASFVHVPSAKPKRPRGRPPKCVLAEIVAAARTAGSFTN